MQIQLNKGIKAEVVGSEVRIKDERSGGEVWVEATPLGDGSHELNPIFMDGEVGAISSEKTIDNLQQYLFAHPVKASND